MCMIELATKTTTADSKIGSQRTVRKCIGSLFPSNKNGRIRCEAILFRPDGQGWGGRTNSAGQFLRSRERSDLVYLFVVDLERTRPLRTNQRVGDTAPLFRSRQTQHCFNAPENQLFDGALLPVALAINSLKGTSGISIVIRMALSCDICSTL
jgi:hypothetical protein